MSKKIGKANNGQTVPKRPAEYKRKGVTVPSKPPRPKK